jgi:hypothetical protein
VAHSEEIAHEGKPLSAIDCGEWIVDPRKPQVQSMILTELQMVETSDGKKRSLIASSSKA